MYDINPLGTKLYLRDLERQIADLSRPRSAFRPAPPRGRALLAAVTRLLGVTPAQPQPDLGAVIIELVFVACLRMAAGACEVRRLSLDLRV